MVRHAVPGPPAVPVPEPLSEHHPPGADPPPGSLLVGLQAFALPVAGGAMSMVDDEDPQGLEDEEEPLPWGAEVGHRGPPGPFAPRPWQESVGIARLQNLLEPLNVPGCPPTHDPPENIEQYQELLQDYCKDTLEDEDAVQERADRIMAIRTLKAERPSWLTLAPAYQDARCWRPYILENVEYLEPRALAWLGEVATTPDFGQFEVNRILHHLFKDSTSQKMAERASPSKWLHRACIESLTAMREWDLWDCDRQRAQGLIWVHDGVGPQAGLVLAACRERLEFLVERALGACIKALPANQELLEFLVGLA